MSDPRKVYLGDGVYVTHDGYHLILTTATNTIFLEPKVWEALDAYVRASADLDKSNRRK